MEELKELINMVANIPSMALWVIAAFWAYKVIVIGSVYGLIRFGIDKIHNYLTSPRTINSKIDLGDFALSGDRDQLRIQLKRIADITNRHSGSAAASFIWDNDVEWLADAIDTKLLNEKVKNGEIKVR